MNVTTKQIFETTSCLQTQTFSTNFFVNNSTKQIKNHLSKLRKI